MDKHYNFIRFFGTKRNRCKRQPFPRQPLAPAAPFPPRLHAEPNYIKEAFFIINKSLSSAWTSPSHIIQRFSKAPGEAFIPHCLRVAPTSGRFEWHPVNRGAGNPLFPSLYRQKGKGNGRCERLAPLAWAIRVLKRLGR